MTVMTRREFLIWRMCFNIYGPMHWRRNDWNFAKIQNDILGGRDSSARDTLLNFEYVENKESGDAEKSVQTLMALGLPQKDIDELMRAANG